VSRVYIIVVNWNGWKDTIECLDSLLKLAYPDFRIIVCDNDSQDESLAKLREWGEQTFAVYPDQWQELTGESAENGRGSSTALCTIVKNDSNLGFGGGTNVGLRYALACADSDYCWLLNNDTVVDPFALTKMVQRLHEKPEACMCGSTLREYGDRTKIQALGGAIYFKWLGLAWHIGRTIRGNALLDPAVVEKKMDYIVGASLLVRSAYLKEVGLMAEDYFLYFEEIDWIYRGQGRYSLAYAPDSIVYHKIGASVGTSANPLRKSYQCDYYTLRNRLVFTRRYCPAALPCIYLCLMAEMIVRFMLGRTDLAGMIWRLIRSGGSGTRIS